MLPFLKAAILEVKGKFSTKYMEVNNFFNKSSLMIMGVIAPVSALWWLRIGRCGVNMLFVHALHFGVVGRTYCPLLMPFD